MGHHDYSSELTADAIKKLGTTYRSEDSEQKRRTADAVGSDLAEIEICMFSLLYGSTARGTSVSIDVGEFSYNSDIDIVCFIDSTLLDSESLLEVYKQIFSIEASMDKVEITVYDIAIVDRVLNDDPSAAILFARRFDSGVILHGESAAITYRKMLEERLEANDLFKLYETLESMYQSYAEAHVNDTKFRLLVALSHTEDTTLKNITIYEDGEYESKWVE